MKTIAEFWMDVPGYEGLYQASNYGRIRSLDNQKHAIENGLKTFNKTSGENCYITNLTNNLVREIRAKLDDGVRNKDIEKEYNLSRSTVSRIKMRQSFKNI